MPNKAIKLSVLDKAGKSVGDLQLSEQIFGAEVNVPLVAQVVKVYLSNQRKAFPKTKRRGEVKGSGKKIWPQKGTGRARHGDRYAPIFVGGGIAHGPRGNQSYRKNLPKKMKKLALISVLSAKQKENKIKLVKGIKRLKKTKSAQESVVNWFGKDFDPQKKYLLVLPGHLDVAHRAFRNLAYLNVCTVNGLNPYQVLNHDWLILTADGIKDLENRLTK
jgi:large subunit ribosomal protein L4